MWKLCHLTYVTRHVLITDSVDHHRGVHRALMGKPEGKSHSGDEDVYGRIILRWIFSKLGGGRGDWMELAQDRDRW
jgi:hypothetical protein